MELVLPFLTPIYLIMFFDRCDIILLHFFVHRFSLPFLFRFFLFNLVINFNNSEQGYLFLPISEFLNQLLLPFLSFLLLNLLFYLEIVLVVKDAQEVKGFFVEVPNFLKLFLFRLQKRKLYSLCVRGLHFYVQRLR